MDKQLKMIVIGNSGVGKTCIVRKFTKNAFKPDYSMTIGVEFESKDTFVNNEKIQL